MLIVEDDDDDSVEEIKNPAIVEAVRQIPEIEFVEKQKTKKVRAVAVDKKRKQTAKHRKVLIIDSSD